MEKSARQFIDDWSESYMWHEELQAGNVTVAEMLENLKKLQSDYERQGLSTDEIDWSAVERELKKHAD